MAVLVGSTFITGSIVQSTKRWYLSYS